MTPRRSSYRRNSGTRQFSWRHTNGSVRKRSCNIDQVEFNNQRNPILALVTPCLDNLDLPFADDEDDNDNDADAATANMNNVHLAPHAVRLLSSAEQVDKQAMPSQHQTHGSLTKTAPRRHSSLHRAGTMTSSRRHHRARAMSTHHADFNRNRDRKVLEDRRGEPTHFRWNASIRVKKKRLSETYVIKKTSNNHVSCFYSVICYKSTV